MYKAVVVCDSKNIIDAFDSIELWNNSEFSLIEVVKNINEIQSDNYNLLISPVKNILEKNNVDLQKSKNFVAKIFYGRKSFEHIKCAIDNGACGYIPIPVDEDNFKIAVNNASKLLAVSIILIILLPQTETFLPYLTAEFTIC